MGVLAHIIHRVLETFFFVLVRMRPFIRFSQNEHNLKNLRVKKYFVKNGPTIFKQFRYHEMINMENIAKAARSAKPEILSFC